MSIDKKAFGLSDSLVNAVNEALKGGQKKIDVAPPFGKLTGADFKKLRGEDAKPDYLDFDKDGNKKEPMKQALKQMKEVADGNKTNFKANMKEGPEEKDKTNPKQGSSVDPKQRSIGEAAAVGAPAPNMAAAMDARKSEVQRKIAQKQAMHQQSKAKQRIAGTMKEGGNKSCSCGETKESKMSCEVHGDKKMLKGGKEPIVMNPPLKEAGELPKKVITKGHEIAKSLIKHRAKVKSPYAVGMATAKKSAGIKEEADLDEAAITGNVGHGYHGNVKADGDEDRAKKYSAMHSKVKKLAGAAGHLKDARQPNKMVKHFLDSPHGRHVADDPSDRNITSRFGTFKKGYKSHMHEEVEQVDELSKETMKSYVKAVDKRGEGVKRGTGLNTASQKIAKQEPTSTLKKTVDAIKNTPHGKMKSSSVYKFGASHAELQRRGVKD
jgi:hypothetical protein